MGIGVEIDLNTGIFVFVPEELTFSDNTGSVGSAGRVTLRNVCIAVVEIGRRESYGVPDAIIGVGPGFRRQAKSGRSWELNPYVWGERFPSISRADPGLGLFSPS